MTLTFEPSGGLLNASLVMQDKETDSYWSIMTDEAIYGTAKGRTLEQVPGSIKTTWGDWKRRHPTTRVLSVDGTEHDPRRPYDRYFESEEGFRKLATGDRRLADKAHLYGLHAGDRAFAVPHDRFPGGAVVDAGGRDLFVFRASDDSFYRSTAAFWPAEGSRFARTSDGWQVTDGERSATWDGERRRFHDGEGLVEPASGFDTFWYIWSLTNPQTEIVGPKGE